MNGKYPSEFPEERIFKDEESQELRTSDEATELIGMPPDILVRTSFINRFYGSLM